MFPLQENCNISLSHKALSYIFGPKQGEPLFTTYTEGESGNNQTVTHQKTKHKNITR